MTGIDPLAMAIQDRPLWRDVSLFLPIWAIMMAAMMLPAFLPMAITFSNVSRRRRATSHTYVPIWVFVAGYVVLWSLSGVPGYISKIGLESLSGQFPSVQTGAALVGALVVIGAGLYQLTPWKDRCLSHCRNPMSFVMHDWQEGYAGAFRMGINPGMVLSRMLLGIDAGYAPSWHHEFDVDGGSRSCDTAGKGWHIPCGFLASLGWPSRRPVLTWRSG